MSGRLPKLICLIASGLFDVLSLDYREEDLYGRVIEHLEEDLRSYFQNIWLSLNGDHRCVLTISAIKSILQARRIDSELQYISFQDITQDTAFLSRLGLLDDNRNHSHILLGPQSFIYFIIFDILYREKVLAHSFRDFLRRIGLDGWAIQSHSDVLERAMQEIPWGLRGNSSDFIVWLMSQSETGQSTVPAQAGSQHWSDWAAGQIETRGLDSERVPTGPSLRRILDSAFPGDSALVAFCVDYFPEVARRLGQGMDTVTKQTVLLQNEEAHRIWGAVRNCVPEQTLASLLMQDRVEWEERRSA